MDPALPSPLPVTYIFAPGQMATIRVRPWPSTMHLTLPENSWAQSGLQESCQQKPARHHPQPSTWGGTGLRIPLAAGARHGGEGWAQGSSKAMPLPLCKCLSRVLPLHARLRLEWIADGILGRSKDHAHGRRRVTDPNPVLAVRARNL